MGRNQINGLKTVNRRLRSPFNASQNQLKFMTLHILCHFQDCLCLLKEILILIERYLWKIEKVKTLFNFILRNAQIIFHLKWNLEKKSRIRCEILFARFLFYLWVWTWTWAWPFFSFPRFIFWVCNICVCLYIKH